VIFAVLFFGDICFTVEILGVKRLVGFPLCDEIELAEEIPKIKSKGSEKSKLVRFLKDRDLDLNYAHTAHYS
jgi:hypothetical protein